MYLYILNNETPHHRFGKKEVNVEREFNLTVKDVIKMPDWEFDLMKETLEQEGNEEALIKLEDLLDAAAMSIDKRAIDIDMSLNEAKKKLGAAYIRYADTLSDLADSVEACSSMLNTEFERFINRMNLSIPNLGPFEKGEEYEGELHFKDDRRSGEQGIG